MRIKRLFATMAVGATVTSGLVLGVAPASADPSNPFQVTPMRCYGLTVQGVSSGCKLQPYTSGGRRIGYTQSWWFQGVRVNLQTRETPGIKCTTYTSGGRIQGTACKNWVNG